MIGTKGAFQFPVLICKRICKETYVTSKHKNPYNQYTHWAQ